LTQSLTKWLCPRLCPAYPGPSALLRLVLKRNLSLLLQDQRAYEAVRFAGSWHVYLNGQYAGDSALKVRYVLRWRVLFFLQKLSSPRFELEAVALQLRGAGGHRHRFASGPGLQRCYEPHRVVAIEVERVLVRLEPLRLDSNSYSAGRNS